MWDRMTVLLIISGPLAENSIAGQVSSPAVAPQLSDVTSAYAHAYAHVLEARACARVTSPSWVRQREIYARCDDRQFRKFAKVRRRPVSNRRPLYLETSA